MGRSPTPFPARNGPALKNILRLIWGFKRRLTTKAKEPMKKESVYLKVDTRNRISLTKLSKNLSSIYKARVHENKIILEPVQEVAEDEAWLFLPENKKILARLKKSLKEKATIDLGSFKKYLKE